MIDGFMPGRSFKFPQARGPGQLWCEQKNIMCITGYKIVFQIAGVAPGVQDGDSVGAVAQQPKLVATRSAFTLWLVGGDKIVTWGNRDYGGDSSRVQDQLRNVQQISCTGGAYAAILADGSVVAWGDPYYGGDCSGVQDELRNVKQISCAGGAYAAILADGSIVAWGDPYYGGDCSGVQDELRNVKQISCAGGAYAAILADGSVVTWGCPDPGGDCSAVQDQLIYISTQVRARAVRANKKCGCHIPVLVAFVDFPAGCFS